MNIPSLAGVEYITLLMHHMKLKNYKLANGVEFEYTENSHYTLTLPVIPPRKLRGGLP